MTLAIPDPAVLRALHPGPLWNEQALDPAGQIIGRDRAQADILIQGSAISRRHCWLGQSDSGQWLLRDLDSTNGVFINGQRIEAERHLAHGDVIGLGQERVPDFEFSCHGPDGPRIDRPLVGDGPWLIGRDPGLPVSLSADARVSKHHARLRRKRDNWFIEDLGSRNGTWLDGQRIRRARLKSDSKLIIGHYQLSLARLSAAETIMTITPIQPAIGLQAVELAWNSQPDRAINFIVAAGGLQFIQAPDPVVQQELADGIEGHGTWRDHLRFSDELVERHNDYRRERVAHCDAEPGLMPGQTLSQWLADQARLALAADLSSQQYRELASTVLAWLGLEDRADRRLSELGALEQTLARVAAGLITQPGLLLLEWPDALPDKTDQAELLQRLRDLTRNQLTILVLSTHPIDALKAGEAVAIETSSLAQLPDQSDRHQTIGPPPARRLSLAATSVLVRRGLYRLVEFPGTAIEAMLLPILLLPALWFLLPERPSELLTVLTILTATALASAALVSRQFGFIDGTARRWALLDDVLLAWLLLSLGLAAVQTLIAAGLVWLLPSSSAVSMGALAAALSACAISGVSLGLLAGCLAGHRTIFAVVLAMLLIGLQMLTIEPTTGLPARLQDLSAAFWALELYRLITENAALPELLRPPAFIAGQTLLFLGLARLLLKSFETRRREDAKDSLGS
jgi:pSer/pThr/pTyr-binding forkhead associated (FHA) protein/ABC-type lipoprotein export system ATPase subunit